MSRSVREMENNISLLEMQLAAEKEKVLNLQDHLSKSSAKMQNIIARFKEFCCAILERDITTGEIDSLSIRQMSLMQLLDAAEASYKNDQKRNQELLKRFGKKLENKNQTISDLTNQLSQLWMKLSMFEGSATLPDPNDEPDCQRAVASLNATGKEIDYKGINNTDKISEKIDGDSFSSALVIESTSDQVSISKKPVSKNSDDGEHSPDITEKYELIDIEKSMSGITELMWECIRVIGIYGLSERKEIVSQVLLDYPHEKRPSESLIGTALINLKTKVFVEDQTVSTGIRWLNVYRLTDAGEKAFIRKYKKRPVLSEMDKLQKEHDNYYHGYIIKDAADVLKSWGEFDSITTDRKSNAIRVVENKISIPDIVAVKGKQYFYYEVECGNHVNADFFDKCNKLMRITKDIYFIVKNNETIQKLRHQIESWITSCGGIDVLRESGIVVYLTTMTALKDKKWMYTYRMDSESPHIYNALKNNEPEKEEDKNE